MPRLQVHSKGSGSLNGQDIHSCRKMCNDKESDRNGHKYISHLVATLVHVTGCIVVHSQHRNKPVGGAVSLNQIEKIHKRRKQIWLKHSYPSWTFYIMS